MLKKFKSIFVFLLILPMAFMLVSCKNNKRREQDDIVTYKITYVLDGGVNNSNNLNTYNSGNSEIILQEPTKEGYEFDGWFLDENFDNQVTKIDKNSTGNKTFYAKWNLISYKLTYILNGGKIDDENSLYYDILTSFVLKEPTREGYIFKGWFLEKKFENQITQIELGSTGDKFLYAKWEIETYNINYILNGGTNSENNPTTYTVDGETIIEDPTFDFYTFDGWYFDSAYLSKMTKLTSGDVTLYAKWKTTIKYKLYGGNNDNNPTEYIYGEDDIDLKEPSRVGYKFLGWYINSDLTESVTQIDTHTEIEKTYYTKWEIIKYNITYVLNVDFDDNYTNENVAYFTIDDEYEYIRLKKATRDGYDFDGWFLDIELSIPIADIDVSNKNNLHDFTIYASWKIKTFEIEFKYNCDDYSGENLYKKKKVVFKNNFGTLPSPTRENYNFIGWYKDNIKYESDSIYKFNTSIYLTAVWKEKENQVYYTVTFNSDGGTPVDKIENLPFGSKIPEPDPIPEKKGYEFNGWLYEGKEWIFDEMDLVLDKIEITLIARWKPITYYITYELNGGENNPNNIESYNVDDNPNPIKFNVPTRVGYEFVNWYYDENFTETNLVTTFDTKEAKDITIYARWNPITLTIFFDYGYNENNLDKSKEVKYDDYIGDLPEPTKTGYNFGGWKLGDNIYDSDTQVKFVENITLVADWTLIKYKIEYILGLDDILNPNEKEDYTILDEIEFKKLTNIEIDGIKYEFEGWYKDSEFKNKISGISLGSTGDLVIYAHWTRPFVVEIRLNLPQVFERTNFKNSTYNISAGITKDLEEVLGNFINTNLEKYFNNYSYKNDKNETVYIKIEDLKNGNYFPTYSNQDIIIEANWNLDDLIKYYYTDGLSFDIKNNDAFVSGYDGTSETIIIPEYYKSYPITKINKNCFSNNKKIYEVRFLERKTNSIIIGESAFKECTSLTIFDFDYVSEIGKNAFSKTGLTEVIVGNQLKGIGSSAFEGCSSLTTVNLKSANENFKSISTNLFKDCTRLENVTLATTVDEIFDSAFENTSLDNINFLSGSIKLHSKIFNGCIKLIDIEIPENVTPVEEDSSIFEGCENLTTISIHHLYMDTFETWFGTDSTINKIIIKGNSVIEIPTGYFSGLTYLTEFIMSDSIETIGSNAFDSCKNLNSIYFSKNLNLTKFSIDLLKNTKWFENISSYANINKTIIYVSPEITELNISEGIKAISNDAVKNNKNLTKVTIPSSLEEIGKNAFSNCEKLVTVEFASNSQLKIIYEQAFYSCHNLVNFSLKNCTSLKEIQSEAFYELGFNSSGFVGGEDDFVLPSSLETIASKAFASAKIKKYKIENNTKFLTDNDGILYEKDDNNKLSIIVAPITFTRDFFVIDSNSITKIYDYAFYNSAIAYVFVKGNVELGTNVFNPSINLLLYKYKDGETETYSSVDFGEFSDGNEYSNTYNFEKLEGVTYNKDSNEFTITDSSVESGYYYVKVKTNESYEYYLIFVENNEVIDYYNITLYKQYLEI